MQHQSAMIPIGAGFGTIVSGIFFLALAEIISRLPEPLKKAKTCPQCTETIKTEAKKCRFCGFGFQVAAAHSMTMKDLQRESAQR